MKVLEENLTESLVKLKESMRNGVVEFTYLKKDGSERVAKGTLNSKIMGEDNVPKGTMDYASDSTTRYFDVNSNGWRSFSNTNLVSINI